MKLFTSFAVLVAATIGCASASVVQYNTNGSAFSNVAGLSNGGTTLTVTSGANTLTLNYTGPGSPGTADVFVTTPTNLSYGFLDLSYNGGATPITVPSFTFTVHINDITQGLSGNFVGTSSGGTVSTASSTVNIFYTPLSLSLGTDQFQIFSPTPIPAPVSLFGQASIQGHVDNTATPEPGTMFLLGAGLIGIGISARKKFANRR